MSSALFAYAYSPYTFSLADDFWIRIKRSSALTPIIEQARSDLKRWKYIKKSKHPTFNELLAALSLSTKGREVVRESLCKLKRLPSSPEKFHLYPSKPKKLTPLPRVAQEVKSLGHVPDAASSFRMDELQWWFGKVIEQSEEVAHAAYSPKGKSLKFLTLNVWGLHSFPFLSSKDRARYEFISKELTNSSYDIVALQEVWNSEALKILNTSGFPYFTVGPKTGELSQSSGLAILSKYPIIHSSFTPFPIRRGVERFVLKGILHACINSPIGHVDTYTLHAVSEPESINKIFVTQKEFSEIREAQVKLLSELIHSRSSNRPYIVLGDFNLPDTDDGYKKAIKNIGVDLFVAHRSDDWEASEKYDYSRGFTFCPHSNSFAKNPSNTDERIDYILVDPITALRSLYAAGTTFVEAPLSDHYGVQGEVRFLS